MVNLYGKGIWHRNKPKPWNVGFTRQGRSIYIGSYYTLKDARWAAEQFLRNETLCLSQLQDSRTEIVST